MYDGKSELTIEELHNESKLTWTGKLSSESDTRSEAEATHQRKMSDTSNALIYEGDNPGREHSVSERDISKLFLQLKCPSYGGEIWMSIMQNIIEVVRRRVKAKESS